MAFSPEDATDALWKVLFQITHHVYVPKITLLFNEIHAETGTSSLVMHF